MQKEHDVQALLNDIHELGERFLAATAAANEALDKLATQERAAWDDMVRRNQATLNGMVRLSTEANEKLHANLERLSNDLNKAGVS